MASFLAQNLQIIKQRWPQVAAALAAASPEPRAELVQDGPQATLLIDGIHLTSSYDRAAEARLQASLIPEEAPEAWVYGIGLGDLPRELLRRSALRRIHVVLINPAVAGQSFEFFDQRDWLGDERVEILTASAQNQVHFPFAAVPSCLQLADDASARLRDLVVLELATPFIRKHHAADNPELLARLLENEPIVAADADVAELFDRYPGETILVAGAGPSLSEHFEKLRKRKSPLIAVDAALKALTKAGVVPDVVTVLDGDADMMEKLIAHADLSLCAHTPLVYFPTVSRRVLDLWPGPRYAAYSSAPLFQQMKQRLPRAELFSAGSVIHPTVDLAVLMGARCVFLLGADFAYPQNLSHTAGCEMSHEIEARFIREWVHDWRGRRVGTTPNLRGYLRDLETYIAGCPQVDFFCGGAVGARKNGVQLLEDCCDF